jgi:hypothetical protein
MEAVPRAASPLIALVGNPNCGKTALFNILTGSRQKVANYAGVTVERKEGSLLTPSGRKVRVLDLPGAYSLDPLTPDEQVTADVLLGRRAGESQPDFVVCVTDATNLRQNLRLALSLKRLGLPMVIALNMIDIARRKGIVIDADRLAAELGVPVVETIGVKSTGVAGLVGLLDRLPPPDGARPRAVWITPSAADLEHDQAEVRRILGLVGGDRLHGVTFSDRVDAVVLHPIWGTLLLATILFLVFQAVFAWAQIPMDAIKAGVASLGEWLSAALPASLLRDLLVNGVLAGVGSVLVFLPQIMILFFFILLLEDTGYLPRAAFLLDRLMGSVGLSGRAFIPLLSSFACAIPGIMATRTIQNPRDRIATIMIAPLMTCSARLPVYALIIGAFIPHRVLAGGLELQGLVLFALYLLGVASALAVAFVLKRSAGHRSPAPDARAAGLSRAEPAQSGARAVAAHRDLHEPRRHHHSRAHGDPLGPVVVPGAAAGRRRSADPVQHRGSHRRVARRAVRAARLQLADLHRARARPRGARGRGRRARHRVRAVRDGQRRERRTDALDLAFLEPADRPVAPGLVCVRPAVPLDARDRQTRDEFVALSLDHGGVSVRDGVCRVLDHVSRRLGAREIMSGPMRLARVLRQSRLDRRPGWCDR